MLRVVSLNTLANRCATVTPHGSPHGFPHADPAILDWNYRCNLIENKITNWCTERYIICLQEVDMKDWYCELLHKLGYQVLLGV